ncbi:carboxymuconolactone decarboxylase family protein [Paucibacter sp. APW11]|uniref:Carboxymuconolactone decarboxylase family protein n=1 Tax=Roseateles aquae TaxID=3077235 RepID=A0ABU3P9K3_9BURK|nr:carboxymuconolactone decarboxylase family protein [Paucibacter sp. APW11]MDT8998768.1 carboxymuconolactone decarboxylase family protein [Paucibacter sp. APW11]
MPLIEPLAADANPEVSELATLFNRTLGFVPNSVMTMMRRPAIARAFTALNAAVMHNEGRVSSELKRLIGHLCSASSGCRYCEAHTIRAAERFGAEEGADPRRLAELWNFRSSPLFSAAERAALEFAIAAAAVPNAVDEPIGATLREYWDEGEIVEILGVIALFGFLNRWNDSMGTELEAPAKADGRRHLAVRGWTPGKHG